MKRDMSVARAPASLTRMASAMLLAVAFCPIAEVHSQETLVIYSGRAKGLVDPLVEKFREKTGVQAEVRYGGTAQLALAIGQEGMRSPCDVFWAQDTGALELLTRENLFSRVPDSLSEKIQSAFRSPDQTWIASSARARVIAYAPSRISTSDLPKSVFDLEDSKWKGRIGWSPANASFQAFVTAMRSKYGDERTRQWLIAVRDNEAKAYPRNSPILDGIAAGEIDIGLLNHYYLHQRKKERPDFPVEQTTFEAGDLGNLVFVAGAGILKSSKQQENARKFLEFLLSDTAQEYFTSEVSEYPVTAEVNPAKSLPDREPLSKAAPEIQYSELQDLDGTLKLLRDLGLL